MGSASEPQQHLSRADRHLSVLAGTIATRDPGRCPIYIIHGTDRKMVMHQSVETLL